MQTKMIEIRDSGTTIAAIAIRMLADGPVERRFLRHCGYPDDGSSVTLMRLADQLATNDPYSWAELRQGTRTMQVAHDFILRNWPDIIDGQVVDVQVILGERDTPKTPEVGMYDPEAAHV